MTLSSLLKSYEQRYLPTIIDIARSKSAIKHLMVYGDREVDQIDYLALEQYRSTRKEQGVSDATINKELAVFGSAIKWGNNAGLIKYSVKIPRVRETPRAEAASPEEIQALVDAAPNLQTKCFIALLFSTGQRSNAVLKLKWSQIKRGVIEFDNDGYEKASRRKRRARTPLTDEIKHILATLRSEFGDTEYVFPPGKGEAGYCKEMPTWFRKTADSVEIVGKSHRITPHVIRHSAVSAALANGFSMMEVSRMAGHSNTHITERVYAHLQADFIAPTVSGLGKMVKI